MQFVNNWQRDIELAIGATSAAVDLPNGAYTLTLAHDGAHEIVSAAVSGGVATLTRGQEGTAAQEWPAGSVIYCSITAATVTQIFAQLSALDARVTALETPPIEAQAVVASASAADRYGYDAGSDFTSALGSISPAGALAIPDAEPLVGAAGEIRRLVWHSPDHVSFPGEMHLVIRGSYSSASSLPFTEMIIDGVSFPRSSASMDFLDGARLVSWSGVTNPLPAGERAVNFA